MIVAETPLALRLAGLSCPFREASISVTTTLFSEPGLSSELLKGPVKGRKAKAKLA